MVNYTAISGQIILILLPLFGSYNCFRMNRAKIFTGPTLRSCNFKQCSKSLAVALDAPVQGIFLR